MDNNINTVPPKQSILVLVAAWLIVAVPAAWGVSQTIHKSLPLFNSAHPPASTPAPATSSPDLSSHH